MNIVLSREAGDCLAAIARHYSRLNPAAARKVRDDIEATLRRIALHPNIYVLIGRQDIRRAVTRRYAYVDYFRTVGADTIAILSVRGGAQAPRFPRP